MRAQHEHAERLFDELLDRADRIAAAGDDQDAYPLSLCLAKIAGVLRTHFAIEDQVLYPALIGSPNSEVAVLARKFQLEMGHLADQFEHFLQRWGRSAEIAAALPRFRYESEMMFCAIRERIRRENRELYPLIDRLHAEEAASAAAPDSPVEEPAPLVASRPFEGFVLRSAKVA